MTSAEPLVTVRFWAAARRAAAQNSEELSASSLAQLRAHLQHRPELASLLPACSFLVDGTVTTAEDQPLRPGTVVDVLPPFAGG